MVMTVATDQWQLQEAKQHFSELIRAVQTRGPQIVTKHGEQVAVVLDIVDYRRMTGVEVVADFKSFLASAPDLSELEIERSTEPAREVDFE
jgi:prevent-host-death family protein